MNGFGLEGAFFLAKEYSGRSSDPPRPLVPNVFLQVAVLNDLCWSNVHGFQNVSHVVNRNQRICFDFNLSLV